MVAISQNNDVFEGILIEDVTHILYKATSRIRMDGMRERLEIDQVIKEEHAYPALYEQAARMLIARKTERTHILRTITRSMESSMVGTPEQQIRLEILQKQIKLLEKATFITRTMIHRQSGRQRVMDTVENALHAPVTAK